MLLVLCKGHGYFKAVWEKTPLCSFRKLGNSRFLFTRQVSHYSVFEVVNPKSPISHINKVCVFALVGNALDSSAFKFTSTIKELFYDFEYAKNEKELDIDLSSYNRLKPDLE